MKKNCLALLFLLTGFTAWAQPKNKTTQSAPVAVTTEKSADDQLLRKVTYRQVGPFRGGRSAAVVGSRLQKNTFYFGATGGGVWKTNDAGSNWKNISDKFFGGT
ncbi:MAG: hypothetical protein ACK46Z_11805, partial [Bacteroidota bacterium]